MRRRRPWWSGAVLVVAALGLSGCAAAPAAPGASPTETPKPPAAVTVGDRVIPFDGLQRWTLASVPDRASTSVTVFAVGTDRGGGPCGPPVVRLSATESGTTVRVAVADYQEPAEPDTGCPAVAYIGGPQRLVLDRALGDRRLVDASTGKAATLLVAADYPSLPVPAGYGALPFGQLTGTSSATQVWVDTEGNAALSLATTTPAATRLHPAYGKVVRRFSIDGTPAAVDSTGDGPYDQWEVQWVPNRRQAITLGLTNAPHHRWSAGDAERLARSVTGYRTERTGRLQLPATPGTTVAAYSSVEGPVRHAPNMWKSSGIYVGLRCEGVGTVSVSLRGRTYPFDCTERAVQDVVRSDGLANETFFLDVTATDGVRWTVALARASLDGS